MPLTLCILVSMVNTCLTPYLAILNSFVISLGKVASFSVIAVSVLVIGYPLIFMVFFFIKSKRQIPKKNVASAYCCWKVKAVSQVLKDDKIISACEEWVTSLKLF